MRANSSAVLGQLAASAGSTPVLARWVSLPAAHQFAPRAPNS